ncbi:uncharacterized protein E0L32_003050 [Thyridium curvatum]|uniref:Uncharacterized protein n=1 Tax=Thyridium curvatum TaxID=1093900 RepID=A0A507BBX6_9PEZI|nr:uncharacterized protein E0L32_003050 [Thyridium curvatum]TPX17407.1 hypothetical protein E0L32_003050 [Thyridium curvatum]
MIYAPRSTLGRIQDQHLTAAARLGGIKIDEQFYQTSHRPGTYSRLLRVEWAQQKDLNEEAKAQVFLVAEKRSTAMAHRTARKKHHILNNNSSQDMTRWPAEALETVSSNTTGSDSDGSETASETDSSDTTLQILPEVKKAVQGPQGLQYLISSLVTPDFGVDDARQLCLRIHGKLISSTEDLKHVHRLLCRKTSGLRSNEEVGIIRIIIDIALRYYKQVHVPTSSSKIAGLTMQGKNPMHRKCNICGTQLLDDPFPRFKKTDPTRYVARYLKGGCGMATCKAQGDNAWAVPSDDSIPWCLADANALKRVPRRAAWSDFLLRKGDLSTDLAYSIQCICRGCNSAESIVMDSSARWTIETLPRYIPRKPRCTVCKKSTTWKPVDASIEWLDAAALSKKWTQICKEQWSIDEVLKTPDRFFSCRANAD